MRVPLSCRRGASACLALVLGLGIAAARGAVPAAAQGTAQGTATFAALAGTWDIALPSANRRCRINLTRDRTATGFAVAMPAGCRRAFPMLGKVASWTAAAGDHVVLQGADGASLLDFGPQGGAFLIAVAGGEDRYTLIPTDQGRKEAVAAEPSDAGSTPPAGGAMPPARGATSAAAPATAPARVPAARPVSAGEVAGYYAVVRAGRDTGCMVTLDDKSKAAKGGFKARLAPACGDQGIVIFDPVGWTVLHDALVLTARRGHTTELKRQDDGTWSNAPASGRALILKRL